MVQTVSGQQETADKTLARDLYLKAFRIMLLARTADDKFASLWRAGRIHGGVFLGRGQEALSVSTGIALREGDVFAPLIRDQAGRLAFGEPLLDAARTFLGSRLGPMRGRDGNIHRGRPKEGLLAMISHLGAMISVVNGALLARRMKGITGTVGVASVGDGTTSTGSFHEAINQASIEKLPLVLVIANNYYAYSTPNSRQFACSSLADKAIGYGVQAHKVDGTDLNACINVVGNAVSRAREGEGPQMVVASLLRLCGHGEHDDASYVDEKLKGLPECQDCLKLAEEYIRQQNWADSEAIGQWRTDAVQKVDEVIAKVQREPAPDPFSEEWHALASKHLMEIHERQAQ
jgi:TPP-dependent pyruvate/acetoin dehydrogenase alpha subunit